MESFIPRMFHIDPARTAGLLLSLLLLLAMQVWAEDSNTPMVTPPQTSVPAAPSAPSEPAQTNAGHSAQDAEMALRISEEMAHTIEQEIDKAFGDKHIAGLAILIPLLAIFFIFGGPIILVIIMVVLHYRAKARRERQQSENIAQLLAAGKDVPLELLRGDESDETGENNLRKGVKNIGIGVGLLLFLTLFMGISIGAVGFIMIGLGISQLVIWKLADSKTAPSTLQD